MTPFELKVRELRILQKRYFTMRDSFTLSSVKKLEKEIDEELKVLERLHFQPPIKERISINTELDLFADERKAFGN